MGTDTGWREQGSQETDAANDASSYRAVPLWQQCLTAIPVYLDISS